MLPLSSVLSVTMSQIDSTLASLSQWAWHPSHTPASQSALCPLLTDDMLPMDLLQELVSLLTLVTAAFLTVFGPLHWCSTAQWPTSWSHPTAGILTLTGGAEIVSLSFLGLFPSLLLEKDLALADQFLKGEPMRVH